MLAKLGFTGPIYATEATADLAAIMLRDSATIQERDSQVIARREGRRVVLELPDEWPDAFRACLGRWHGDLPRLPQSPLAELEDKLS
jgi:Cft2 family RNA processing exonuclease